MASNGRREFKHPRATVDDNAELTFDDLLALSDAQAETETVLWNGRRLTVRHLLSFREVSQFINRVMDFCFDEEHEIAIPEAADFAIRINVFIAYAGILSDADIESQYRVAYESGLYELLLTKINTAQLDAIRQTVQTCVYHMM